MTITIEQLSRGNYFTLEGREALARRMEESGHTNVFIGIVFALWQGSELHYQGKSDSVDIAVSILENARFEVEKLQREFGSWDGLRNKRDLNNENLQGQIVTRRTPQRFLKRPPESVIDFDLFELKK